MNTDTPPHKGQPGPHGVQTGRQRLHTFHAIVREALAELIHDDEADAGRVIGSAQFLGEKARVALVGEV